MRIVAVPDGGRLIAAGCSCGEVIDVADAMFAPCTEHTGAGCLRCGGGGEVVDHRALAWRAATPAELALLWETL
jgi:hypothetical protein